MSDDTTSTPAAPPAGEPATPPATPPAPAGDGTDWKAMARQWEQRAKENKTAAEELAALKASQMSEQERAVSEAEARGRTAAAAEYGKELATARFEAAAARVGVQLGEAAALIDMGRFVGDDGKPDASAIDAAVKQLAALAPQSAGRSGGDMSAGTGDQPPSLEKRIAEAEAAGDTRTVLALKTQQLRQITIT